MKLLLAYLDGTPLRKISDQTGLSPMNVFRKCEEQLKILPRNFQLTRKSCDLQKFSGILVFDGKYFKVKGYPEGVVLLWGVDFLTHDLPHYLLAP